MTIALCLVNLVCAIVVITLNVKTAKMNRETKKKLEKLNERLDNIKFRVLE